MYISSTTVGWFITSHYHLTLKAAASSRVSRENTVWTILNEADPWLATTSDAIKCLISCASSTNSRAAWLSTIGYYKNMYVSGINAIIIMYAYNRHNNKNSILTWLLSISVLTAKCASYGVSWWRRPSGTNVSPVAIDANLCYTIPWSIATKQAHISMTANWCCENRIILYNCKLYNKSVIYVVYHHISLLHHSLVSRCGIRWCWSLDIEGSLRVFFHLHGS